MARDTIGAIREVNGAFEGDSTVQYKADRNPITQKLKVTKTVQQNPLPKLEPLPEFDHSQALVHVSDADKRKMKREKLKQQAKVISKNEPKSYFEYYDRSGKATFVTGGGIGSFQRGA
jgi:hypothetical protein